MDTDKIAEEMRTANLIAFLAVLTPSGRRERGWALEDEIARRLR